MLDRRLLGCAEVQKRDAVADQLEALKPDHDKKSQTESHELGAQASYFARGILFLQSHVSGPPLVWEVRRQQRLVEAGLPLQTVRRPQPNWA